MKPELFTIPFLNYPVKSYGFMLMIGFFSAIYIAAKRAEKVRANPDMVINLGFFCIDRRRGRGADDVCDSLLGDEFCRREESDFFGVGYYARRNGVFRRGDWRVCADGGVLVGEAGVDSLVF